MGADADTSVQVMPAVPSVQRRLIISGMRWTVWLSILAAPFSYGTTVLLARVGPEVIGTYGLLMIYIGVVSSLLYLGGDPVVIKFVPHLAADKRLEFLGSYFVVICLSLIPWLAGITLWPEKLRYLFGNQGGVWFQVLVLYLAPVYIATTLVVAGLKAVLEMRWAQVLARILTFGTFLAYAALYLGSTQFLRAHPKGLIWGVYLLLTGLTFALGLRRLTRLEGWRCERRAMRFFLPRGFWKYTLATQQGSALGFFLQRLDLILVLNFGGLDLLGKYVTIITLAGLIQVAGRFFLDTLLPSLTNLLAAGNLQGASQVFSMNLRIAFAVNMAVTSGLMFLVGPIAELLGPQYATQRPLFVVMVLFYGLASPGGVGSTLLTSIGKQQRTVWIWLGHIALFTALFLTLWSRWQIAGAVLASGVSMLISYITMIAVAKYSAPIRFSVAKDYAWFVLLGGVAGIAALRLMPLEPIGGVLAALVTMLLFLLLAGYRFAECRALLKCFVPERLGLSA